MINNEAIKTELAKYNVTDAAIQRMADEYLALRVNGIADKAGLSLVHESRMVVKNKRIEVEKTRKELKEDSLAYGRAVDSEAKRITAMLAPIEEHLQSEEDRINAAKEAIKRAAEETEKARLAVFGAARLAEIEKKRIEEEARLDAIRAEQAKERERLAEIALKQAEEQDALRRERDKIEAEKRAIEAAKQKSIDDAKRAEELESARKEAAEKAKIEAESRLERERIAKEKAEKDRLQQEQKAEQKRIEELPDKEKLKLLSGKLRTLEYPAVNSGGAKRSISDAQDHIASAVDELNAFINS